MGRAATGMPYRLGWILGFTVASLATAQSHQLRLTPLVHPPNTATGLLLKGSLNGGSPLRLLLDSGAEYLVIDRRAAKRSGIPDAGTDFDLIGAGTAIRRGQVTGAVTVTVGDLTLRDCPLMVVKGRVAEGIDGVIPLSLFDRYEIELDVPARTLTLKPPAPASSHPDAVRALLHHKLLFLQTRLQREVEGYLLLDTGSSFNVISDASADALSQPRALATPVSLSAGVGATSGRILSTGIPFHLGNQTLNLDRVIAIDLTEMSRRHGLNLAGVIGYPALVTSRLTIDYTRSLVRIETH